MAQDQSEAVWKAVRARLIADTSLAATLGAAPANKVARRALPGDTLPCIICPSVEATERGTDSTDAQTIRLELHLWAKANDLSSGTLRAALMKEQVYTSLHWAPIGTRCTVESITGPLADPDPSLSHFVVVVEVISDHADS